MAKSEAFTDADILGILDAANSGEVEQGKVAVAKGQIEAVRSFGQMMVTEHGAPRSRARPCRMCRNPEASPCRALF